MKCISCGDPLKGKGRWWLFGELLCAICYDWYARWFYYRYPSVYEIKTNNPDRKEAR